mgnify:CR=1 FL=1
MKYKIEVNAVSINGTAGTLLKVGFGEPAQNDEIVREVEARLNELKGNGLGGAVVLINGPASLPVAVVLGHHLAHQFGAIGVFDPKMAGYIVSASHGSTHKVGDVIPASEVS